MCWCRALPPQGGGLLSTPLTAARDGSALRLGSSSALLGGTPQLGGGGGVWLSSAPKPGGSALGGGMAPKPAKKAGSGAAAAPDNASQDEEVVLVERRGMHGPAQVCWRSSVGASDACSPNCCASPCTRQDDDPLGPSAGLPIGRSALLSKGGKGALAIWRGVMGGVMGGGAWRQISRWPCR